MTPAVKAIVEDVLSCRCGQCEGAVQDILRMEQMLCTRAKQALTRRRNRIRLVARHPYYSKRYQARRQR